MSTVGRLTLTFVVRDVRCSRSSRSAALVVIPSSYSGWDAGGNPPVACCATTVASTVSVALVASVALDDAQAAAAKSSLIDTTRRPAASSRDAAIPARYPDLQCTH